jgi:hypothetical protein
MQLAAVADCCVGTVVLVFVRRRCNESANIVEVLLARN